MSKEVSESRILHLWNWSFFEACYDETSFKQDKRGRCHKILGALNYKVKQIIRWGLMQGT